MDRLERLAEGGDLHQQRGVVVIDIRVAAAEALPDAVVRQAQKTLAAVAALELLDLQKPAVAELMEPFAELRQPLR